MLEKLSVEECKSVLQRALDIYRAAEEDVDDEQGHEDGTASLDDDLLDFLAGAADGDARVALSTLELALKSGGSLSKEDLRRNLLKAHLQYDRTGDQVGAI